MLLIPLPQFEYELSPYHMVFIGHMINSNLICEWWRWQKALGGIHALEGDFFYFMQSEGECLKLVTPYEWVMNQFSNKGSALTEGCIFRSCHTKATKYKNYIQHAESSVATFNYLPFFHAHSMCVNKLLLSIMDYNLLV